MKRKLAGDTLIEVMFAFAVLSTIASVTFAGALSSYKSSIGAQWRTKATFAAQYQAEALLAYRRSLSWDVFLNGSNLNASVGKIPSGSFCMKINPTNSNNLSYWTIDSSTCNTVASNLMDGVPSSKISIDINQPDPNDNSKRIANIVVSWQNKNGQEETVKNILLLTKEQ